MDLHLTRKLPVILIIAALALLASCKTDDACEAGTTANAGQDQEVIGTSTTLEGNTPTHGVGTWKVISGENGEIADASNPESTFTGMLGIPYTLRWSITGCPSSEDDVVISFISTAPALTAVDKTSVINGDIITVTGVNFSSNYNGGSQINSIKTADPFSGQEVYLPILSRTATEIKAVVVGTNGGASGSYNLRYNKKPDAGAATIHSSSLNITINGATEGQFFTSSSFTDTNIGQGEEASFGVQNGSTTAGDYSVKLVGYNYETGIATEYDAVVASVTADGYGSMDKLAFTIPAELPDGSYYVKVTYNETTLIGGWGNSLNVF